MYPASKKLTKFHLWSILKTMKLFGKKKLVLGPYLGSLLVIEQAGQGSGSLQEHLNLKDEETIRIMSEFLKAELALLWMNIEPHQTKISADYYARVIEEMLKELRDNTPNLPQL